MLRTLLALSPRAFREDVGEDVLAVALARIEEGRSGVMREAVGMVRLACGLRLDEMRTKTKNGEGRMTMNAWIQDVHHAARSLRRNPGFAATAAAVLALGVGANTAIFSAVNAFVFSPLPFADESRLVTVFETNPEFGWDDETAAPANLLDWREQVDAFADVSGYSEFTNQVTTLREGEPVLVGTTTVLGNFFETLGVQAALGRTLRFDETWEGANGVVVISHSLWVEYFGADPGVIGRTLELNGTAPEIVGVMPAGFSFPSDDTQLWAPFGWAPEARGETWFRRAHWVRAFARLNDGVTRREADAQLQVVVGRLQAEYPETNAVMGAGLMPMRDFLIRGVRTQLLVLLGAVALLLLLACTNVANLMLVRANDRAREMAVRQALGAQRARVARQVLLESLMIALAGATLGLVGGWLGVRAITAGDPLGIDGATALTLDHRVVLFTVGAGILSGLLFGTLPALRTMGGPVEAHLREQGRGNSGNRRGARIAGTLVATEVALALLLVVGAGLMIRTFASLRSVDPGFDREGIVAVQFSVPSTRYAERDQVLDFYDRFLESLESRAGVLSAGTVGQLPLSGASWSSSFVAENWVPDRIGFEIVHRRADSDYFETVGTPLVRGRLFDADDGPDAPLVVVVNETLAREHFRDEDPIGQRITYDRQPGPDANWYEIIGIVADQHQVAPGVPPRAEAFEHRDQDWGRDAWVVVRGEGEAEALFPVIRATLDEMDPLIPVVRSETLQDVWRRSMAREELVLTLLTVFGVVALLLAAVGVYGVTAQAARRRTQEIGIRMALGAGGRDVLAMMLRQGFVVIVLGISVGLLASFALTRTLESLLYGVEPTDPPTLAAVALLLGVVALVACWLPARRATAVDPVTPLRSD